MRKGMVRGFQSFNHSLDLPLVYQHPPRTSSATNSFIGLLIYAHGYTHLLIMYFGPCQAVFSSLSSLYPSSFLLTTFRLYQSAQKVGRSRTKAYQHMVVRA